MRLSKIMFFYSYIFDSTELDLPTYDEAMLLNLDDDFDINLEKIQCSFAQLYSQQGKSKY